MNFNVNFIDCFRWIIATVLSCIALTVLAQEDIPKKVNLQPRRSIARGLQRTSTTTAPPPPPEDEVCIRLAANNYFLA